MELVPCMCACNLVLVRLHAERCMLLVLLKVGTTYL